MRYIGICCISLYKVNKTIYIRNHRIVLSVITR